MDTRVSLFLLVGFVLRVVVPAFLVPGITTMLDKSVLFSTPINSYRSLQEGIFLLKNGLDPYGGAIVHHPPLLLVGFSLLPANPIVSDIIFALVDTLIALQIIQLNKNLPVLYKRNKVEDKFSSLVICLSYVLNPLSLLTTFSKSTVLFTNLLILIAINQLLQKKYQLTIISISIASYLSFYPCYLLVPIIYYIYLNNDKHSSLLAVAFKSVLLFASLISSLFYLSYQITGSVNFIDAIYTSIILFKQINPNLGFWWYFFTEVFTFFSDFFIGVFNIYSFVFVIPLTIRFKKDLIFAIWIIICLSAFTKSYPTLADINLFYSMIFLWKSIYSKLKVSPLISFLIIGCVLLLLPVFYYVWMTLNSGNANFFYAIGLAYVVDQLIVVSDFIWAWLQLEYYDKNNIDYDEEIKLTQI